MHPSPAVSSTRNIVSRQNKSLLIGIAIVALEVLCFAKTTKLTGKIVAYDLMRHNTKNAAAGQNQEVVVLETSDTKRKYVKVMFSSFGTTQIESKYFEGAQPLAIETFRDHSCDEKAPRFVSQVSLEHLEGTYLLTEPFKTSPPGKMKLLECYIAIQRKK